LNHCILIVAALVWFFTVCDMMNLYVCLWLGFVIIKLVYGESMFGPRLLAAHQVKSFLIGINTITKNFPSTPTIILSPLQTIIFSYFTPIYYLTSPLQTFSGT
jgi:hypothetical protein